MGGLSAEREVSLTSGAAVAEALESLGKYKVSTLDAGRDVANKLAALNPDVVFNALHGTYGEDGCIQGVLETLAIPYTHSGVLASSLAMDKPMAKRVFEAENIRTAEGAVLDFATLKRDGAGMAYPVVVKPTDDGSSVGVTISNTAEEIAALDYKEDTVLLIERYIPGREIQVAVLENTALGAIEIKPNAGFYDYEAKYTDGKAQHIMPAPLPADRYEEVLALGLKAHQALGCRGLSRTDFRYDDTEGGNGHFYILETNTQPGMTPLSLAPEIAAHKGMDFASLVHKLVESATLDR